MTAIELRTSIATDLDQMSVEMLESVSRYVKRLATRSRNPRLKSAAHRREAAMQFVQGLSMKGGLPVPADERGIEALISEKYSSR